MFRTTVDLIDMCDSGGDSAALRATLEGFGARVNRLPIGRASHLAQALSGDSQAPYIVISAHGGEGGIYVPELAPELAAVEPFDRLMLPADIHRHARLTNGPVVVSAACDSGQAPVVEAFLDAGASAFIGPAGAIEGTAALFGLIHLFYGLVALGEPLEAALERVRARDAQCALFRLTRVEPAPSAASGSDLARIRAAVSRSRSR